MPAKFPLLRILAHQVAVWLACGEKPLTYDDETPVYYLARVTNKIDLETQIIRVKKFTVQFKCRPYAYSAVTSNEQIEFGKGLMCGYGYRFDMVPTVYNIISNATKSIYNPGTWVKPVIRVVGTCSSISFAVNGKTLAYGAAVNGQIDIDCYKQEAYKDGVSSQANNVLNNVSGDWLEMINGDNTLQISGTDLNCTVTFIFNYLYL
jgi:phage-related protein